MARDWEADARRRADEDRAAREAAASSPDIAAERERILNRRRGSLYTDASDKARDLAASDVARRAAMDADPSYRPDYAYEGVVDAGPSAYDGLGADAASIEAQRRALGMLQTQAETQGFTPAERSMQQSVMRQAEQSARGQRMADLQALEARGMGGSGMSMVAGQMAGQAGADRAADFGAQAMMAAQQRALAAMSQYGQAASQMRGQSFAEGATRANGLDAWNQALAQRAQGVEGRNAERYNQAEDQGFSNRFQREALAQGAYGMERSGEQADKDRAWQSEQQRRQNESDLIRGVIGGVQGAVGSIGGAG